ncbi:MAG: metal-dependent hydrolase [Candidatus Sigynarchaeum springense]
MEAFTTNEFVHFFTGYLIARALKYREHRFECFLMAFAGFLPDMDYILRFFVPAFSHGVWTHTIVFGFFLAFLLAFCACAAFANQWKGTRSAGRLLLHFVALAIIGVSSHLALDAWTYYESAADQVHHMFFWPVWNFPVHINTMFPAATYDIRVLVEVAYSIFVGVVILFVQWAWKKQNPFKAFVPSNWLVPSNQPPATEPGAKLPWQILAFAISCHAVLVFYFLISVIS